MTRIARIKWVAILALCVMGAGCVGHGSPQARRSAHRANGVLMAAGAATIITALATSSECKRSGPPEPLLPDIEGLGCGIHDGVGTVLDLVAIGAGLAMIIGGAAAMNSTAAHSEVSVTATTNNASTVDATPANDGRRSALQPPHISLTPAPRANAEHTPATDTARSPRTDADDTRATDIARARQAKEPSPAQAEKPSPLYMPGR